MKFFLTCLTIFGYLVGPGSFAAEVDDCRITLIDLMSLSDQDVNALNSILCAKGANYFRECASLYLDANKEEVGFKFYNYMKEAEYVEYLEICK
jgi:hypothetical protein